MRPFLTGRNSMQEGMEFLPVAFVKYRGAKTKEGWAQIAAEPERWGGTDRAGFMDLHCK